MDVPNLTTKRVDSYRGTILVTELPSGQWVATWLPRDESDPDYPGWSRSSLDVSDMPIAAGADAVLAWAKSQWGPQWGP